MILLEIWASVLHDAVKLLEHHFESDVLQEVEGALALLGEHHGVTTICWSQARRERPVLGLPQAIIPVRNV